MPYESGEIPMPGDHVRNKWGKPTTVTQVDLDPGNTPGFDQVSVQWDDGSVGVSISLAVEYTLISRAE